MIHTRLRLGCCGFNYYLFKVKCKLPSICACNEYHESVAHYLLKCPRYAAPGQNLLSSAAQIFGNNWCLLSDLEKVNIFLHGSTNLDMLDNLILVMFVQQYIKETKRFL
jgi:hypothetical protein